jgi:uncharacterized protein (DUF1697 family)
MKYVALLRGIGPSNPNMHGDKLKEFFEKIGMKNARPVISSGNVVFESEKSAKEIQELAEGEIEKRLGFFRDIIIKSQKELEDFINKDPFKDYDSTHSSNLNVTFLKNPTKSTISFPHKPENKSYTLLRMYDGQILTSLMTPTGDRAPDLMIYLEKKFSKQITTRTWKTVHRILSAMEK